MWKSRSTKLIRTPHTQLGSWNSTIQNSSWLWPFYYSCNENTVYRGYRKDWYSNEKYQFDAYQGDNKELFDFVPINWNIDLKHMPSDAVPVDIICTPCSWCVCQHQPRTEPPKPPAPITNSIQFVQSQPDYISQ